MDKFSHIFLDSLYRIIFQFLRGSMALETLKNEYNKIKEQAFKDYFHFLKFQSISSEPTYKKDIYACVDWLVKYIRDIGFQVEVWETKGHPTIFAHYDKAGPDQPTLLIYNHYDVQPVDPLDLWDSPPFEPTIRNGEVYARGAQDNKGQCFYVLLALKTLMKLNNSFPINIKLCIEGEEECGSVALSELLKTKKKELKADYLSIVDVGVPSMTMPAITLGVRGIVTMDVEFEGSNSDLHSGSLGGLAYNPLHALIEVLGKARDADGKITIPGFYDDVVPMNPGDKQHLAPSIDVAKLEESFSMKLSGGEKGLPHIERNWFRPTLEVNGVSGGYSGEGFKTVIPAKALAKISCRIVPNQDPEKIGALVANFMKKNCPDGIKVSVTIHEGGGKALRAKIDSKIVIAYSEAYKEVFGKPCQYIFTGASIPIVTELAAAAQAEVVLVGLGLSTDYIHAPNEHFGVERIEKGCLITARLLQLLKEEK